MATPSSGVLLNLLNAMNSGKKPTGEHRSSLLQVTDIVPIDLDEKTLIPRQGFYIKLSDSSHYVYASLPFDEDDLVLSNKLQLGQYIYIDMLEPGSPVPKAKGIKLLNGRHPLLGTPKPLMGSRSKGEKSDQKGNLGFSSNRRRGSWVMKIDDDDDDNVASHVALKPIPLNFDQFTPVKDKPRSFHKFNAPISPLVRGRVSIGGGCMPKIEQTPQRRQKRRESSVLMSRNSVTPLKFDSSPAAVGEIKCCSNQIVPACVTEDAKNSKLIVPACGNNEIFTADGDTDSSSALSLSGKLGIIGKEVVDQKESAQKIAIQALRNASATENIVRCLEMFADLSKRSKPEAPISCLEEFLEFHSQIMQAVTDMVSIQAATEQSKEKSNLLHEIKPKEQRRRLSMCKSNATILSKTSESSCCLSNMITLGKQIEIEAGKWFMEFLEKTMEMGKKKSKDGDMKKKVPQSLMMRVIKWVELQQCHPKAAQIKRRLRMRMKST